MILPPIESVRDIPGKGQGAVDLIVASAGLALAHSQPVTVVSGVLPYSMEHGTADEETLQKGVRSAGWRDAYYVKAGIAVVGGKVTRCEGFAFAQCPTKLHAPPPSLDHALDSFVNASVKTESITHEAAISSGRGAEWTVRFPVTVTEKSFAKLLERIEEAGWMIRTHDNNTIWLLTADVS